MNKLDPRVDANPADPNVTSGEVPGHGTTTTVVTLPLQVESEELLMKPTSTTSMTKI
jgi:hypothetical protein